MSPVDLIAGTNPEPFSTSKTSNWVARVGGLPTLIQHVAHDLLPHAGTTSHAIEMAVGIVKNWAHGHDGHGHSVSAATVAEAVKAIAEWNAKRAAAHALAHTPEQHDAIDLCFHLRDADVIELAGFTEMLHPRLGKGSTGGGRFAKKGSGGQQGKGTPKGINPKAMPKTERGHAIGSHAHARDVLSRIGGVKRGPKDQQRRRKSDLTVLARRWNAMSPAKRIAAMKAFQQRQASLPKGWKFDAKGNIVVTKNLARLRRAVNRKLSEAIFGPDIELAPSVAERDRAESQGNAMQGGRFPIRNAADLANAIRAVGRAKPATDEERAKVRRFIIKRARELNLSNRIPDNWNSDGSMKS